MPPIKEPLLGKAHGWSAANSSSTRSSISVSVISLSGYSPYWGLFLLELICFHHSMVRRTSFFLFLCRSYRHISNTTFQIWSQVWNNFLLNTSTEVRRTAIETEQARLKYSCVESDSWKTTKNNNVSWWNHVELQQPDGSRYSWSCRTMRHKRWRERLPRKATVSRFSKLL